MALTRTTTTTTTASAHRRSPLQALTRLFNPLTMRLAGTRIFPLYGVMQHRGRRSGRLFRTPVVVKATRDGFIVPMPWGEGTDWYRNVHAAGECTIRWKGRDYPLVDPQVITNAPHNAPEFSRFERSMMTRFGINLAVHLRHRST